MLPETEHRRRSGSELVFQADAGFAKPEIYEALEGRGVRRAMRLPATVSLERDTEELLARPLGRSSHKPVVFYQDFPYHTASWKTTLRVVTKREFHFGELLPRGGFILTNLETDIREGGAVLQQPGHGGAVDQRRQTGGEDVAAELSSLPV